MVANAATSKLPAQAPTWATLPMYSSKPWIVSFSHLDPSGHKLSHHMKYWSLCFLKCFTAAVRIDLWLCCCWLEASTDWATAINKQFPKPSLLTRSTPSGEGLNLQALSIRASPNRNSSGPFPPVSFIHGNVLRIRSGFLFQLFRFNWGRDQRRKIIRRRRFLPQINPKFTFQLGDATQESGVPITLNHHKTTIIKRGPFIKQLKIILWGFRKSLFFHKWFPSFSRFFSLSSTAVNLAACRKRTTSSASQCRGAERKTQDWLRLVTTLLSSDMERTPSCLTL